MIQISLFIAVAGLNNKIYAMGREFTYQDITSRLEIVDPISGVGTAKAPMPTARTMRAASAANGKIFADPKIAFVGELWNEEAKLKLRG